MKRHLLAIALFTTIACASAPPHQPVPAQPPAAPGAIGITFEPKIAGATASLIGAPSASCTTSDDAGAVFCFPVPVGDQALTVSLPDGVELMDDALTASVSSGQTTDIVGHLRVPAAATIANEHGFIHVNGTDFADEDGRPWPFAGYAHYTIMADIAQGKDLGPFFDEAAAYGANTIVALGMDGGQWARDNGRFVDPRNPQWAGWLASLYDQAAAKHMRVALGVFQQAQLLSLEEQRAVWETAKAVSCGRWNVFLRLGNEDDVNGWRHADFARPGDCGGVLVSTGSRGINNPPTPPNWDFAEWEPRRDPVYKAMDDAGAGVLEQHNGYPGFPAYKGPVVVIEPPFFHDTTPDMYGDSRWTDPKLALQLGLEIGANSAGGAFGSSLGLIGQPNGPNAAECARQFFRGLRAAFQR